MSEDPDERGRARRQLDQMVQYAEARGCRRKFLLGYFGEAWLEEKCGGCDVCLGKQATVPDTVLQTIEDFDQGLFGRLRSLRRQLADARGVPAYVVASDRTLQEMARLFPQSLDSLESIHGIGKEKRKLFGEPFIATICQYFRETGAREDLTQRIQATEVMGDKKQVTDTLQETKAFIKQKLPLTEIARLRGLAPSTILGHIEKLLRQEILDIEYLRPNGPRLNIIHRAFQQTNGFALTPVRQRLGEDFSYEELRLGRLFLETGAKPFYPSSLT